MKVTITYIHLKSPFHFFALAAMAMKIVQQLKHSKSKAFKKKGIWTKHYTMTLWDDTQDLKDFATNGTHLEAMKNSAQIAKEIKTITIEAHQLPTWDEAMRLLEDAKCIRY